MSKLLLCIIFVGAQMAAMYGRGAPAPSREAPYGRGGPMGDIPQPVQPTAQPTVPSGRCPSPPEAQQRRPSPPQAQQRGPEVGFSCWYEFTVRCLVISSPCKPLYCNSTKESWAAHYPKSFSTSSPGSTKRHSWYARNQGVFRNKQSHLFY